MSFSSTPLGQGRRLDHHTFLNKANPRDNRPPHSPPRRAIPTSYSYGAPTAGSRSPPKSNTSAPSEGQTDNSDEPALVRFARLKQREQAQAHTGPQPYLAPHPEKWTVKDTSVNIAGAFNQAVDDNTTLNHMNPNDAWASGARRQIVPRSTSVEYEKETQSTVNRRLAPPPSRTGAARVPKPVSKTSSIHVVPDSEGEDSLGAANQTSGGKSPFEAVRDISRRFAPVSFLMRQRSQEPESSHANMTNGHSVEQEVSSYSYESEEREYRASAAADQAEQPVLRRNAAAHRRNRISLDNKAYKPSVSDLEESDEDFEDEDGKRTRRRKKKGGAVGGPPLTSLPVAGYDKRKKRRRANGKTNGAEDEDEEDEESSDEQEQVSEQRSQRETTPKLRTSSLPRDPHSGSSRSSLPPPGDLSHGHTTLDVEQALEPISEIDEDLVIDEFDRPQRSFSVGAALGKTLHGLVRLGWSTLQFVFGFLALLARMLGKVLGSTIDILINRPLRWVMNADPVPFVRYAVIGLTIYSAWYALNQGWLDLSSFPLRSSPRTLYQPPDVPAGNLGELSDRLQRVESALAKLSFDTERSRNNLENSRSEMAGRMGALESQVHRESVRTLESETKFRTSTNDALQAVKHEVEALHTEIRLTKESQARQTGPVQGSDEEARAKLRALEERVGSAESGVKEALELSKNAAKVGGQTAAGAAWWNKLASGKSSGVTIKSSDGQDVTSLISHLVDSSVSRLSKDQLARPDYALYSSGAQVIPSLTSETYEIPTGGFASQILGYVTGNGATAVGRPPVTALHHEIHNGHCWPFPGQNGQLAVMLAAPTYISDVTIDHVAREVATDMRSAPRQMELWGLVEGDDNKAKLQEWREKRAAKQEEARVAAELAGVPFVEELDAVYPATLPKTPEYVRVANFTYNIYAPQHIQTFPVPDDIRELGVDFGVVVLLVKNNWGRDDFTCLYRLRVHGEPIGNIPGPLPEEYALPT